MNNIEVYEIDDEFDPLEDLGFDEDIEEDGEMRHDYLPPIPDAEFSKVPEARALSPKEAIDALIAGMPGQKQRLMFAIQFCSTPQKLEDIAEAIDSAFPHPGVYSSSQIVKLLEKAGALCATAIEQSEDTSKKPASVSDAANHDDEEEYLSVETPPVYNYTATEEGHQAVEAHVGERRVREVVSEEKRYLPLYQKILEMTSEEGGCATKNLDAVIDPDPLCAEPKRFCGYFLDKLEEVGAVKWQKAWIATKTGKALLETDIFSTEERS